jgi:hypothetical protein
MTAEKQPKKKDAQLVTPSHGRGKIYHGGVPGHRGGTGRPPSELRDQMRSILEGNLGIIEKILQDPEVKAGDKIRALEVLSRFGIGTQDQLDVAGSVVQVDVRNAAESLKQKLEQLRERMAWVEPEPVEILTRLPSDAIPIPPPLDEKARKNGGQKKLPLPPRIVAEEPEETPATFSFPPGRGRILPDHYRQHP